MKKRLPKAQKGLAKLAKVVKTASKTAGKTKSKAAPVVRKAKRIGNAQKSLSASALSGMTASQLRSKLSSLMKEASAASKAKGSTKKLALKRKGGATGVKPPASVKPKGKEKRRLKKNDRRADRMIKKGGDKATINQMREMAKGPLKGTIATKRQTKKFTKKYADELSKPVRKAKMQKGGTTEQAKKLLKKAGKIVTSKSGLTQRVNRKGVVKKNQGGGRPMSAKKAVRKMTRKRG